jgi:branched-chain amino acid transport system ATP-binding protein
VASLFDMIVHLNQELGMTFLLVEQAAQAVLAFSSRAYLLQKGRVAYAGEAKGLMNEVDVLRSAYLGASPTAQSLKG